MIKHNLWKPQPIRRLLLVGTLAALLTGTIQPWPPSSDLVHAAQIERSAPIIELVHGQKQAKINGITRALPTAVPIVNGVTMIPVRLLADATGARIVISKPTALIKMYSIETHSTKLQITPEMRGVRRNGAYSVLTTPVMMIGGSLHVPLPAIKQLWQGAYQYDSKARRLRIELPAEQNAPPVAAFKVNSIVKRGEPLTYTDTSYDPDGRIVKREWENKQEAFFEPGEYTVRLTVYDQEGSAATSHRTITVTEETYLSKMDYFLKFAKLGTKTSLDGTLLNSYPAIQTIGTTLPTNLMLSNAPESFYSAGVLYRDTALGSSRVFYHHKNRTEQPMRFSVIVRNMGDSPARVLINKYGIGSPDIPVLSVGREAIRNYMASNPSNGHLLLAPGESAALLTAFNTSILEPSETVSGMIDFVALRSVEVTVVACSVNDNPPDAAYLLPVLNRVGNRGTFELADRQLQSDEPIGWEPKSIRLGHLGSELEGTDELDGTPSLNAGEYGAITELRLSHVAYGTTVLLNPRAGVFAGALSFNGKVAGAPDTGLVGVGEGILLYRHLPPLNSDGTYDKELSIRYSSPGGSSLPVLLAFLPPID